MPLYFAYGLQFASDLLLPEFMLAEVTETAMKEPISIRIGSVPKTLTNVRSRGSLYELGEYDFLFSLPNIATYHLTNGKAITIQPAPSSDESSIRLFLYDIVLTALFYQRRMFPLHASSIETPKGAVLFMGANGTGKSTLAAFFYQKGFRVLSDNITVLQFDAEKEIVAVPAFPAVEVWEDTLQSLQVNDLTGKIRPLRPNFSKYWLSTEDRFHHQPLRIEAIYYLETNYTQSYDFSTASHLSRIPWINQNMHYLRFARDLGLMGEYWGLMTSLSAVKMHSIRRDVYDYDMRPVLRQLIQEFDS
jgi:hypothetical protein